MNKWVSAGLALLVGCCHTQPSSEKPTPTVTRIDEYKTALELKVKADAEPRAAQRKTLYSEALQQFEASEKNNNNPLEAILNQAECLSALGDNSKAIEIANKSVTRSPSSRAYYVRGFIHYQQKELGKALEDCTNSITLEDNADARYTRSEVYLAIAALNRLTDSASVVNALKDIETYTKLRPNEPDGFVAKYNALIRFSEVRGEHPLSEIGQSALDSLKKAITLLESGIKFKRGYYNATRIEQYKQMYENTLERQKE